MSRYVVRLAGREIPVEILADDGAAGRARVDGRETAFSLEGGHLDLDGARHAVSSSARAEGREVWVDGRAFACEIEDDWALRAASGASRGADRPATLRAPMPGIITRVTVTEGQGVAQGDLLLVLEAMKMANEVRAPRAGTVRALKAAAGRTVSSGEALLTLG